MLKASPCQVLIRRDIQFQVIFTILECFAIVLQAFFALAFLQVNATPDEICLGVFFIIVNQGGAGSNCPLGVAASIL